MAARCCCSFQFQGSNSAIRLARMLLQASKYVSEPCLRIDVIELGGVD